MLLLQACVRAAQGRPELASKELEKFATKYANWITNGATLSGWLTRHRNQVLLGKEQRRWYVLKDKFLFYYREPTDPLPLSGYVLETASIAQDTFSDARDLSMFSFNIPPTINYILDAYDVRTRAEWITVLMEANLIDPFEVNLRYFNDSSSILASSASDISPKDPALIEGWLSKRGSTNKSFKLRWFSLRGTLITYSEREGSKPLGSIDIRNCKVRQGEDGAEAEFPFQLITPIRTYFLDSEHSDTTRAWIVSIFNAQEDAAKISTDSNFSVPTETPYEISLPRSQGKRHSTRPVSMAPNTLSSPSSSPSNSSPPISSGSRASLGLPASSTLSDSPKKSNARHTVNPAIGRKIGGIFSSSPEDGSVDSQALSTPITPYLGESRTRTSGLSENSRNAIELTDFRTPDETVVALAALNEDEENRRNLAAKSARERYAMERSQSEMLSEPLLTREILDDVDVMVAEEKSMFSCCTIS